MKWLKFVIFALFLLVAGWYSVVIPPGEGVDEIPHFDYVGHVKTHAALPIQPATLAEGVDVAMGHHPPLYYVVAAAAISWADLSDFDAVFRPSPQFVWSENDGSNGWNVFLHFGQDSFPWRGSILALHVVRFLTVAAGLAVVIATFRTAELMFPDRPWLAIGITSVVAFNPSFVFMSSTVHHDTLQAAIFAVALWWMIAFLQRDDFQIRHYVAAGVLVGMALLTKLSGLSLALTMAIAIALKTVRDGYSWKWFLRHALTVFAVAGLIAGWWFVRNLILYGDPLGWEMFLTIHAHMVRDGGYSWSVFVNEFLSQIGRTYWGGFGYMHITFPEYSRFLWVVCLLALVGFAVTLVRERRRFAAQWAEWIVIFTLLAIVFASFVRFSIATEGAGHGRYLFPAAFAIAAIIVLGINEFFLQKYQRAVALVLLVGLVGYAVWLPAANVLPKYASPDSIRVEALPESADVAERQVAQGLLLAAFETGSARVQPDASTEVTTYWRAVGAPDQRENPKINLSLRDPNGNVLASRTKWPVAGLTPAVWDAQRLYVQQWELYVAPQEMPEELYLVVTPVAETGAPGPAEGRQEPVILEELVTTGTAMRVDPGEIVNPRQALFGSHTLLRGFQYSPDEVSPGRVMTIDLFWQPVESVDENYSVFVHLVDEAGTLVAQHDRAAGGLTLPMSSWREGEVIRDTYVLTVPESVAPGQYSVWVGMYAWPSLERLPISGDGAAQGDAFNLFNLEIESHG